MWKKFRAILVVVMVVALSMLSMPGTPVLADPGSPPGANSNDLTVTLSVTPIVTYNGNTVTYYMSVSNLENPAPELFTADAVDIVISFYPPAPDGLPVSTPTYTSAPFNLAANGPTVDLPNQLWTVNVNPGVMDAQARVTMTGTLLTDPVNSQVAGQKNISVAVISPNTSVSVTPSANTVYAGDNVTLTVRESNTGNVPLTSPNVVLSNNPVLAPLPLTLIKTSPSYTSGDANANGILDVGETWIWTIPGVVVNATTTFIANGDGLDPSQIHITYPAYPTEQSQTTVTVIGPNTGVTITPSATQVRAGGTVNLTVTENNTGNVPLTSPNVVLTNNPVLGPLPLTLIKTSPSYTSGDINGNGKLDVGESWTWTVTGVVVNDSTTFTAIGDGIDPLQNHITYPAFSAERAQTTVTVISPNTSVSVTSSASTVKPGNNVNLTVTESNTGNVPLTSPNVVLSNTPVLAPLPLTLTKTSPSYTSGDTNANGILDVGETWTWTIPGVVVNDSTTFTAIGDGIDPLQNHITFPTFSAERAQTTVTVPGPNTSVFITPSATMLIRGGTVNLTVTEINTGSDTLTSPNVVLTNNPVLAPLPLTLVKTSPSYTSGDINGNGKLDVGESWTWTVNGVALNATTTFTAIGDGIDTFGNHITYPDFYCERAQTTVTVINPNTQATITPSASIVQPGGTVNLTVTEINAGDVPLTSPKVVLTNNPVLAPLPLTLIKTSPSYTSGDTNDNGVLDVGETWTWTVIGVVVNDSTTFIVNGDGIDPLQNHITYPAYPAERAQTMVIIPQPNTQVTITPSASTVQPGNNVNLTVTESNTGSAPLTSPNVVLSNNPVLAPLPLTLVKTSPSYTSGDTNANGILDVGETWTWTIPGVVVNATTTFTAIGDGLDPSQIHITYPAYPTERAQTIVAVGGSSVPGDANGDGVVDMADVTRVLREILGLSPITSGADANQDGQINMADVTKIQKIILGIT